MADDVILGKVAIMERCVARIREVHAGDDASFTVDPTRQDSIVLNLQRGCEAAIDLAMHVVRSRHLGLPQESREAFEILERSGLVSSEISTRMKRMVGFRNIAVHDYRSLDPEIVLAVVRGRLGDFLEFGAAMLRLA